jgi:hypothetical protein
MIYSVDITTPSGTALSGMQKTLVNISAGLVYNVEFHFPSGCAGLAGLAVFDGLFQVWPSSPGNFFASDNETIRFEDLYLKNEPPMNFQVYTYNLDDTYDHTLSVRIGLVSNEAYIARFLPYYGYDYFLKLLEKLTEQKAEQAAEQVEQLKQSPFEWLIEQGVEVE